MKIDTTSESGFGLYILGNDGALEWLKAMVPSIRHWSPRVNIHLIPFNEKLDETRELCAKYSISILEDYNYEEFDRIGKMLAPESPNVQKMFRKLACFIGGPYERFVYLDADVIGLAPVEIFDTALQAAGKVVLFEGGGDLDFCYPRDPLRSIMEKEYQTAAFNAGFFAGVKGIFTLDDVRGWADDLLKYRSQCWEQGMDQPFINYCVDRSGVKRVNLNEALGKQTEFWARGLRTDLRPEAVNASNVAPGVYMPVIHWATFQIKPYMPLRGLWRHYRLRSSSRLERLAYLARHDFLERAQHVVLKRAQLFAKKIMAPSSGPTSH